MTNEKILAKAIELYPIGTTYKALNTFGVDFSVFVSNLAPSWWHSGQEHVWVKDGGGYVYAKGKWAPIIRPDGSIYNPNIPETTEYLIFN